LCLSLTLSQDFPKLILSRPRFVYVYRSIKNVELLEYWLMI
jgi:hypothetical protein